MSLPAELTVTQVALILGIHRKQVLARIKAGTMSAFRPLQREWRVPLIELKRFPGIWESIEERLSSIENDSE